MNPTNLNFQNELLKSNLEKFNLNTKIWNLEIVEKYFEFLKDKNVEGGFFSNSETEHIFDRHILESMIHIEKILTRVSISRETKIADVGTGPGLPGFLLCCLQEAPKTTFIDSQKKRLNLLKLFSEQIDLSNSIRFIPDRIESVKLKYDIVLMRSTIPYPWSIEMISQIVSEKGFFIPFLAKKNYDFGLESNMIEKFGFEVVEDIEISELKFLGERHIKLLKKKSIKKQSLPRQWSVIQKEIRQVNGKNNFNQ